MSPVTMAAALQLDITVPNFGLQEYMPHTAETDAVFPHAYRYEDGYLHPATSPASASTSTRSWPRGTRTRRRRCR
jgi:mannonate dehydratase